MSLTSMKKQWWLGYSWRLENMTAYAVAFERGVDDGDGGASFWLILDAREALLQDLRGRQLLSGFWLAVWAQTESLLSLPIVALVRDRYLTTAFCQNFNCFFILRNFPSIL